MTEKLLHFIWQFQYFNKTALQTEEGEELIILNQGTLNTNQGPDFLLASVKINNITFVGNIELHINASDWYKHKHSNDENYNNVILHVVWNYDKPLVVKNKIIPTLELKTLVAKLLLQRYKSLMEFTTKIPCQTFLPALTTIGWMSWKERLAAERLEIKATEILQLFQESKQHWEETFWWLLAANFGLKINQQVFKEIAQTIPVQVLAKHKNQMQQLEALLFGQANFLNEKPTDEYTTLLQKEFQFLQHKYKLKKVNAKVLFLRMRPASFPTIRLAQLAMLIHNSSHLFSKIKELKTVEEVKLLFDITANDYWHYHYNFSEKSAYQPKSLGNQMIENIIINTVVPMLFAYGLYNKEEHYKTKAIEWLQALSPEKNSVITEWKNTEITAQTAFDTQALLQLNKFYCTKLNCLSCAVGVKILRASN
ncbi:MAG TPA: DUF2851 family protein [Chitinophagaceae bacterium]|nr:DUF2851 family protein [Chitinophagaceae bacterium]HNM34155.1 DUF2851 family protein [Chitinophagaceae bacterium]HNN32057.1 DUF2851 family protein [Chitinophagaceae bacterium]